MIKNTLFIWACDYSETSGEGKLARLFIKKKFPEKKYNLKFSQKKTMYQKYISTIFGIMYCWRKYLSDERVCYLNYLPLWNFLIFIFLPPQTILGPITGGANFSIHPDPVNDCLKRRRKTKAGAFGAVNVRVGASPCDYNARLVLSAEGRTVRRNTYYFRFLHRRGCGCECYHLQKSRELAHTEAHF